MGMFDQLALKVTGGKAFDAANALRKVKFGGAGYAFAGLLGGTIGGITGLARGDNYDSTAALRNFTGGAMGGAALGMGFRAALPRLPRAIGNISGLRHAALAPKGARFAAFRNAPVPLILAAGARGANEAAGKAIKGAGFLGRHPGAVAAAGILGGAAMYMNAGPDRSMENAQMDGQDSRTEFMASTQNLVQGMHRGRHR